MFREKSNEEPNPSHYYIVPRYITCNTILKCNIIIGSAATEHNTIKKTDTFLSPVVYVGSFYV